MNTVFSAFLLINKTDGLKTSDIWLSVNLAHKNVRFQRETLEKIQCVSCLWGIKKRGV